MGGIQGSRSVGSEDKPERLSASFFGEGEAAELSRGPEAEGSLESLDGALLLRQTPGLHGGREPWLSGGVYRDTGWAEFFLRPAPGSPKRLAP